MNNRSESQRVLVLSSRMLKSWEVCADLIGLSGPAYDFLNPGPEVFRPTYQVRRFGQSMFPIQFHLGMNLGKIAGLLAEFATNGDVQQI